MEPRIHSRFSKKKPPLKPASKKEAYKEQATEIEQQLRRLIIQMIDDDADEQQTMVLRHALKKLQFGLRLLR